MTVKKVQTSTMYGINWHQVEKLQREGFLTGKSFEHNEIRLLMQAQKADRERFVAFERRLRAEYASSLVVR